MDDGEFFKWNVRAAVFGPLRVNGTPGEAVGPKVQIDPRIPRHLFKVGDRWLRVADCTEVDPPGWWEST